MTLLMGHSPLLFGCKTATSFLPSLRGPGPLSFLSAAVLLRLQGPVQHFWPIHPAGGQSARPVCQEKDSADGWMSASVAATFGPFRLHETPLTQLSTTTPRCSRLNPTQSTNSELNHPSPSTFETSASANHRVLIIRAGTVFPLDKPPFGAVSKFQEPQADVWQAQKSDWQLN